MQWFRISFIFLPQLHNWNAKQQTVLCVLFLSTDLIVFSEMTNEKNEKHNYNVPRWNYGKMNSNWKRDRDGKESD